MTFVLVLLFAVVLCGVSANPSSRVIIDTGAYVENLERIAQVLKQEGGPEFHICPVLKGDAYGHNVETIAGGVAEAIDNQSIALSAADVPFACVVDTWEAQRVRVASPNMGVLRIRAAVEQDFRLGLTQMGAVPIVEVVGSWESLNSLQKVASELSTVAETHLSIQTTMGRNGFRVTSPQQLQDIVDKVDASLPNVHISGFMTHVGVIPVLPHANQFLSVVCPVAEKFNVASPNSTIWVHWAASSGIEEMAATGRVIPPSELCDPVRASNVKYLVRPGALGYGNEGVSPVSASRQVMSWESTVAVLNYLHAGDTVGYGHSFVTRNTTVGTLPIGWSDGFPFVLPGVNNSFAAKVLVKKSGV
jgi:alanine racemase